MGKKDREMVIGYTFRIGYIYRPTVLFFLNFVMKVLEKIPLGYNKTQLKFLFNTFTR
jgi:hypothetical protein